MKTWLKVLGWLLTIVYFIAGIYVGDNVGRYGFEWGYAIGIWTVGILTLTGCYYLVGIIQRQEDIRDLLVFIASDKKDGKAFSESGMKTVELRVQEIFSKVHYNAENTNNER